MSSTAVFLIGFAFIFGDALIGAGLRKALPEHHLAEDTKDVVRLATGPIGTIAALVHGLLAVLIFWLSMIFASFGLFSRLNPVAEGVLFIAALSASGAIFLIVELGQPFSGLMQISSAPLGNALAPL